MQHLNNSEENEHDSFSILCCEINNVYLMIKSNESDSAGLGEVEPF